MAIFIKKGEKMEFTFNQLDLKVQKSLEEMGFESPTPIQKEAIPLALEGYDIVGQAQTGTGKTAAFGIPIIENINSRERGVKAIVLTPTRELAIQVAHELSLIGKNKGVSAYPIYGGVSIERQANILKRGRNQIVVGTPGRVKDLISRGLLKLDRVRFAVLDEADQMLDMGFIEDIEEILSKTPREKQTLLFSATMPYEIRKLIDNYLKSGYKTIKVGKNLITPKVHQRIIFVKSEDKLKALEKLLKEHQGTSTIVFVKTKRDAAEIEKELQKRSINARAIHGDLSQRQRENVMKAFKEGKVKTLVATDVAARGIDIKDVGLVINYELPENPESYVHRIGRTGRAGREGTAISLVADNEKRRIYRIKGLKHIKPEKFKANDLRDLKQDLLSADVGKVSEKIRKVAKELLRERDPEEVISLLIAKLI
ncbi:DEAD/DEAH box helicase domain protein [Desulfurobacterium thermolithotrophum DSM 11699]|uniref:DEAD/DEAH box helicase domain protein n=2 Tax=Desulfurobacterium thermolithotrophum TaxID=64160 RepID=F0S0B2_DESTD|nr:DEAD/DEAH box helicase domain protein [Desulfurobacterium thermolithotrophum DSM 11699]